MSGQVAADTVTHMTAALVEFLLARLDEDEQTAKAIRDGGPWRHNPRKHWRQPETGHFEEAVFTGPPGDTATCIAGTGESDHPEAIARAAHIARWDPARVLAEVEAKRAIIALHPARGVQGGPPYRWACRCCDYAATDWEGYVDYPCPTLQTLASPFASHPDYDLAWAPQT